MFLPFLFFAPIIGMVPSQATAAALIIVGYLMVSTLTEGEEEAEIEEGIASRTRAKIATTLGQAAKAESVRIAAAVDSSAATV